MKKKLTRLAKILLVLCLVVSDFSSVGLVFADEDSTKFDASINVDATDVYNPTITIKSNEIYDISEDSTYKIMYTEEYTYLDETTETIYEGVINDTDLGSKLDSDDGYLLTLVGVDDIASKFNGVYSVVLSLYADDELVDETTLEFAYNVVGSGLYTKVVMERDGEETSLEENEDEEIVIPSDVSDTDTLTLVSVLLTGNLSPEEVYTVNGVEYIGEELLTTNLAKDESGANIILDYTTLLGGVYEYTVEATVDDVQYEDTIKVKYQDYAYNDTMLNELAENNDMSLVFSSNDSSEGTLYVLTSTTSTMTVADIDAFLSANLNEDISYEIVSLDESEVLDTTSLSSNLSLILTSENNTVKYTFSVLGDINADGILSNEDIDEWISANFGSEEVDLSIDLDQDGEVSLEELSYLLEVIKENDWNITKDEEVDTNNYTTSVKLETDTDSITTGDEFIVSYVLEVGSGNLSGFMGTISYDKEVLELLGVETYMVDEVLEDETMVNNDYWHGLVNEDKFMYLTNASNGYTEGSHEALRFIFKALSSSEETSITLEDTAYVSGLYEVSESSLTPLTLTINASDNNKLDSITVGDEELSLTDGVYEYSITVANEVESVDVSAVAQNIGSTVAIAKDDTLVVGSNVVKITVIAEDGSEQDYYITVNREEAVAEEDTTSTDTDTTSTVVYTSNTTNRNTTNNSSSSTTEEEDNTLIIEEEDISNTTDEDDDDLTIKENNTSKYIIVILIILVIIGLIYLIFKEDKEEKEALEVENNKKNNRK